MVAVFHNRAVMLFQQHQQHAVLHDALIIKQTRHGPEGLAAGIAPRVVHAVGQIQVEIVEQRADVGHHGIEQHEQGDIEGMVQLRANLGGDFFGYALRTCSICWQIFVQHVIRHFCKTQQPDTTSAEFAVLHQIGEYPAHQWNLAARADSLQYGNALLLCLRQQNIHAQFRIKCLPTRQHLINGRVFNVWKIMHPALIMHLTPLFPT